jgi:tetratricopeptide (TPR) repeat protein
MKPLTPHLLISAILGLTFLIYSPALQHEFVNLDDPNHVTANAQIRSLAPENVAHIFTSTVQRTYIPLTIFSFALEYQLAGNNPFLYHLDNILLHLLVVFLIYRLGIALGLHATGAAIAAFIFALHPMHVESVAWVTERKDVLYSAFYLGAVLWYLSFLKSQRWRDYGISLLLGLLSILAKPMALSLPLALLLCDWWIKGTFNKNDGLNKIPYALIILPVAWVTYSINAGIVGQSAGPGIWHPFWAGAFYLKKFFWPVLCVPHYLPSLPVDLLRFEYWSSVLVVVACAGAVLIWPNKWLRFAFLWYILSIFFLLNFNHERVVQVVADRYMYLPSVGFCFLAGYFVQKVRNPAVLIFLVGVALFLAVKTFAQVGVWKDSLTLWNYTIQHSPTSFIAFNNRGRIYEKQQQWEPAMADYKEAIRLNPRYEKAYKNLAMVYEGLGDNNSAFEFYTKAIALKPNYFEAYNNRALLFEKKGDPASALADYDRAIMANPKYALAYVNRAALWMKSGKTDLLIQARHDCQMALRINPSDPTAQTICSAVYQKMP